MNELASKALFARETTVVPPLAASRGWVVNQIDFPVVDVTFLKEGRKTLRVKLVAKEWDDLPPSVELMDANGIHFPPNQGPVNPIFNLSAHPNTGRPFVCMVGTLEYHTHSSHVSDLWDNYRRLPQRGLADLLDQLWSGWLHASP
jgi:hypothetical protein